MPPRRQERGIALILVLIVLPLVAIIMVQLQFETTIGQQLAANVLANQQFKYAIDARVRQIRLRLARDLKNDNEGAQSQGAYDHASDDWGPDWEQGGTAVMVTKGDAEKGDDITLYTEVIDEQSKFNINLLRHTDPRRRARATEMFRALLDLFRDARYGDFEDSEWDVREDEAQQIVEAVLKFLEGETRDERVRGGEIPAPSNELRQNVYTVQDLLFSHELFAEKRLLETFTDMETGQRMPSLGEYLTVYGSGQININTAPIAVLRSVFRSEEGRADVAKQMFNGRGGFLDTDEDEENRQALEEEREQLRQDGDEDGLEETISLYTSVNDLIQNVDGFRDQGFIRREELDLARDFTVRSNVFRVRVSARRQNFVRQQVVVLERHVNGTRTWATEVRAITVAELPQTQGEEAPTLDE
ncbi:MAG: hypothetical protein AAGD14_04150 [Planctomycetota bacterium]